MCEHCSVPSQDCSYLECETYQIVPYQEVLAKWEKTDDSEDRLADYYLAKDGQIYPLEEIPDNEVNRLIVEGMFLLKAVRTEESNSDMIAFVYEEYRIEIQPYSEGGWDYTYYRDGKEVDGGIYDDDSASCYLVLSEIIWEIGKKC